MNCAVISDTLAPKAIDRIINVHFNNFYPLIFEKFENIIELIGSEIPEIPQMPDGLFNIAFSGDGYNL
jgi:hypothetical protein